MLSVIGVTCIFILMQGMPELSYACSGYVWRRALGIMAFTIVLAILIGGIAFRFIGYFHLL